MKNANIVVLYYLNVRKMTNKIIEMDEDTYKEFIKNVISTIELWA